MKTINRVVAGACVTATVFGIPQLRADDIAKSLANPPVASFTGHATEVETLAFNVDGASVGSVSSDSVCLWDPLTGEEAKRLPSGVYQVAAFNRDLSRLAIAHSFHYEVKNSFKGKLRLIDTGNGETLWSINPHGSWDKKFPFPPFVTAVAFSPDGRWLATVGSVTRVGGRHGLAGGVIRLWDVATGKQLWEKDRLSTRVEAVVFSPDGKHLVVGTAGAGGELPEPGEVRVLEAESGGTVVSFSHQSVSKIAIDSKSTLLAMGGSDGTIRITDAYGKPIKTLKAHLGKPGASETDPTGLILGPQKAVRCVAFSPNSRRVAAAGYDRTVRVWNVETGDETNAFPFDAPRINAIAFSPNGLYLAAAGGDEKKSGTCLVWRLEDL